MDRPSIRRALALAAACACACAFAQAPQEEPGAAAPVMRAEPKVQPAPVAAPEPKQRKADPARIDAIVLDAPTASAKALAPASRGAPLQIGFARAVDPLADAAKTAQHLDWSELDGGGHLAAISVQSTGAAAIRAGINAESLPDAALLRFYAPSEGDVFEATGRDVRETVARNLAGGDQSGDAHTYWSPVIEGDAMVIEIELPPGTDPGVVRIAAPMVSHLVASAAKEFALPKASASCEIDVMCYASTWGAESNAVGRIVFTSGGSSYLCSGTLIADQDASSVTPYFLTANHCVGSQSSASSVQSWWFYRSSACNSGTLGPVGTLAGGATLLYASANTDTSFMRFNATPPAGTAYAGWTTAIPGSGASVTGIHHPGGDMQKISFGSIGGYGNCYSTGSGSFNCSNGTAASSTFYGVDWGSGTTEPGSSGSALFANNGQYLVGQLYGGSGTCGSSSDFYGRFDVAYNAALYQWLGGSPGATGGSTTPTPSPTPTPTPAPTFLPTLNYSDMWWNPSESGWGVSLTQHADGQVFAAWYNYNSSGSPAWVVMPGGRWTSSTSITGDVYLTSGTPWMNAWNSSMSERVGTATFTFTASDRATLTYTISNVDGVKQIQRQAFGPVDNTPISNYEDLWWNAAESGWGLSISQHYSTLFAVWYTYGSSGGPTWMVMSGGTWIAPDTYEGTLYRTSAAPASFYQQPFDPSQVAATPVGTMRLQFGGLNDATMTVNVLGVTVVKSITRQSF